MIRKTAQENKNAISGDCICFKISQLKSVATGHLQPYIYDAILRLYQSGINSITSGDVRRNDPTNLNNCYPAICNSMRNVYNACQPYCQTNHANNGANYQITFTNHCCNLNTNFTSQSITNRSPSNSLNDKIDINESRKNHESNNEKPIKNFLIQCSCGKLKDDEFNNIISVNNQNSFYFGYGTGKLKGLNNFTDYKSFENLKDFCNHLNNNGNDYHGKFNLLTEDRIKIFNNYNFNNPNCQLNLNFCIPTYLRYLGDRLFYSEIYKELNNDINTYISFWKSLKEKNIKVLVISTLYGILNYDDYIPNYEQRNTFWKFKNGELLNYTNGEEFHNLTSDNTTNNANLNCSNIICHNELGGSYEGLRNRAKWFVQQVNSIN